jgi:pyruvate kinase
MKENGSNGTVWLLKAGQQLQINCNVDADFRGDDKMIAVDYKNLPKVVKPGNLIKIGDGLIVCIVEKVEGDIVTVTVTNTAEISNHKGVNLPNSKVDLPALTPRDEVDLLFAVKHKLDFIAASFTRKSADIQHIRQVLGEEGKSIKVIAKIENQEGLDNFDSILAVADGIMVARGDLGVEIPIQKVCMAQKMMIHKCNIAGKPVITATQMLESMILNPRPTRAEATDVANAVFDGTDCVMLSGETAKGDYPVETVKVMSRICKSAEASVDYDAFFASQLYHNRKRINRAEAISSSAVKTAHDLEVPLILVLTETGSTARAVAKYKPCMPALVLTTSEQTARQCLISRALWPVVVPAEATDDETIRDAFNLAKKKKWVKPGEDVVIVSGVTHGVSGGTNTLKVVAVPE